jgi:formamidopyrimidine-DNA glycosylase
VVDLLGESTRFPEDWLFNHRWGKGKKDAPGTLPNGAKITFLTVGGRTSCVVPSVQKKTGAVAGEVKEESEGEGKGGKQDTGLVKKKRKKQGEEEEEETKESAKATPRARKSRRK